MLAVDAAFAWRPSWLKSDVFRDLFRGIWLSEQFLYYKKVLFWCFRVFGETNSGFCSKTQWQMFQLVSGRHVGAHPDGHQHGGSIQISINLGKKFLRISCIWKVAMTWNLARVFAYPTSFFSQNLDFIYWMVLILILNGVTLKTSNCYRKNSTLFIHLKYFPKSCRPKWWLPESRSQINHGPKVS